MKRFSAFLFLAALLVALVSAPALATITQYGTTISGGLQTYTGSAAGGVSLADVQASGQSLTIFSVTISSGTAGVHALRSGTTTIANVYLAANTPVTLGTDFWGSQGILLPANTAFTISSSNTITATVRCKSS